ncbi:aminotransferase class V-fold PLP-dependent enzyme [Frankia sp. AgKG'84/4]|uniref:aminotransferase class V-fold PLP-dependent enzyme n=1 Tax=Frankia sp. AgKG'84/4 TaxID=573490 RepID=UPI0020106B52|nr:aminotransferase class V-fold PLP-dependent enzyme [Frankia sp. AgKG'84/4]MCL9795764.1 aminotransferase class V-fold PLP-dependent enzyme [Frankia sp. AgKG'84/4]
MTEASGWPAFDRAPGGAGGEVTGEHLGRGWRAARARSAVTHLDAAGAARPSAATVAAQVEFLRAEAELGAYVAELAVADVLAAARSTLAGLLGPDLAGDDVVFHSSASGAFAALLAAWPLPERARVAMVPSEYGSNRLVLEARAALAGVDLLDLPVDEQGVVDLAVLDRAGISSAGAGRPLGLDEVDLVVFPHVPSQRGFVQPAAGIGRRCAAAGVPLVVDVAQSLGQVDTTGIQASAYVGTSRKWLCGPRGVGFVALRAGVAERLGVAVPSLYSARSDQGGPPLPLPGAARISVGEASVVARVGLAHALTELVESGPRLVFDRIAALAAHGRRVLDGAGGWRVRDRPDSASGIITLRPPEGVDPVAVRDRLYRDEQVLTSAIPPTRSRDLRGPLLRASAHAYNEPGDLDRLARALAADTGRA